MTKLRVALDARWAQAEQRGGVARGLRSLIPRLTGDVDFVAFVNDFWGPLDIQVPTRTLTLPLTTRSMVWLHVRLPLALNKFDGIFHSPFNLMPLWTPVPSLVTIHDVSFATHPHLFPFGKARAYDLNARWAARSASCITTVSCWARDQIADRYRIDPDRIHVVPNGVEPHFRPLEDSDEAAWQAVRSARGIRGPYVVAFGGATRRGLDIALDAWRALERRGLPHTFVALDASGPEESGVTWVPRPNEGELRLILAGADVLIYPTETESFGMPALEAAACGTPTVCPSVGALTEVMGDAAIWCERNSEAVAAATEALLQDPTRRALYARRARETAARWTWDDAASRLLRAYRAVANTT